jgi:hypothetical protein
MSKVALSGNASGTGTFTIASPNSNTDRTLNLPDATGTFVTKASTYIAPVELGSGTADNTTFLRGDNTWQTISTTPTTAQVLTATAGASALAVGTYVFSNRQAGDGTRTIGTNYAGSTLKKQNTSATIVSMGATGTWMYLGSSEVDGNISGLFLRVA